MKKDSRNVMWSLAWIWLVVLFCNVSQAAAPDWQVINYPNYTGVLARVKINGVSIRSEGSLLAAFYGDETTPRGVAEILGDNPDDDIDGEYYFNLLFGSNQANETGFTFKLWNSADDTIYDIDKTLDFDTNYPTRPEIYGGSIGGTFAPCVMNATIPDGKFNLVVAGGTINGTTSTTARFAPGEVITITATPPQTGNALKIWTADVDVEFVGSVLGATTSFIMPATNVSITASFVAKSSMQAVAVRSTTNAGDDTAQEPTSATASADKGKFTFTRTSSSGALTVYFDIRGTAVNGTDYKTISSSVTFASGKTSVELPIEPLYDTFDEGDETVQVVLKPAEPTMTYRGGAVTDATVTIKDPEFATVRYTLSPAAAVTAGAKWKIDDGDWNSSGVTVTTTAGTHTISFKDVNGYNTPASQTVTLAAGENKTGTATYATGPIKYTLTVVKGTINGTTASTAQFEPGEEVTITATIPSGQGLKIWTADKDVEFIGSVLGATTTIRMPSYAVTVTASFVTKSSMQAIAVRSTTNAGDDTAKEPSFAAGAADKGKFTFTRTSSSGALTVYFDIRGTAVNGTDYKTIPSSVTFANGKTSVECEIEPLFDGVTEGDETVQVVLKPATPTQTYRGGAVTDATVIVKDTKPAELYSVTVVNGTSDKTAAVSGETVTITANAPAEGKMFDKWTSNDVTFANETDSTTTFTMPAKAVTVTATYVDIPDVPYHPADCMTKDYHISGLEYLQYAGPVKAAALGNYEYEWNGDDVLSFARKATRGNAASQTRGDAIAVTREVSSAMFMAGSSVEVTLTFSGTDKMVGLFIGEMIPEGWTVVGEAADYVVNGVLRKTWNKLSVDPDGAGIPETFTYVIQAPDGNLAGSYVIASSPEDTGCFADDGIHSIAVEDTVLTNNYHPADCVTKDGKISGIEYLSYAGPVMVAALENFEYTWDEPDVFSLRRKDGTRGGAAADDIAIARSVDTATYEANGQITVTLSIGGAESMVSLFVGERIPEGWSVIGNYSDNVRNGVLRMTWDAPNIPSTVTYTLQAPAENLSASYKIASSSADTGCFIDRVLFLDAGETILTHGSLQKPAEWPQDMTLYSPADGRNFREADSLAVAFGWPAIQNAEGYRLVVAAYDGTIVFDETVEETTVTVRGLERGSYIWNVTAIGDDCIAGTSEDFRFAVVPAVSVPIIIGATADGTAIRLAFDTAEPGYKDGEVTYQIVFYSLDNQTLTNLTQTAAVAGGKAVIDLGVAASNGYLYIRPVTTPESDFTELYIK